jgi:hypothetical protein
MAIITASSKPEYKTSFLGMGDSGWTALEWVMWHKALLKAYPKEEADHIWSKAWVSGVSIFGGGLGTANGSGYFVDVVPEEARTTDAGFREYINKPENSTLKAAVFSGVLGVTVGRALSTTVGVANTGLNSIDNLGAGIENTTKVAKIVLPAILIVASVGLIFYGYNKFGHKIKLAN